MSVFAGGGSQPKAPKLQKVNVPQVGAQALAADKASYAASDADFANRFPQLVTGRQYNIGNAVSNLNGATDPKISSELQRAGLGSPNLGNTEFAQARSLGQPILAKEQRDRNYFQTLLSNNPQRAFGLSGGDVTNIALANLGAQNAYNQNTFGTRINAANQQIAQNAQLYGAIAGAVGSIGSAGIRAYNQPSVSDPYLSYGQYSPYTYPGSTGYNPDIGSIQPPGY